jgi:hypothetical protein
MWRFYFPPGERDSGLADYYSPTPAFVNLGRYVTHCQRCSADLRPSWVDKPDTSRVRLCGACVKRLALQGTIFGTTKYGHEPCFARKFVKTLVFVVELLCGLVVGLL